MLPKPRLIVTWSFVVSVVVVVAWYAIFATGFQGPPPTIPYQGHYIIVRNEPTVGTELWHMASPTEVDGELRAVKTAAGQLNALGVCMQNCGTAGDAVIVPVGQTYCDFDGPVTANHFVQNSLTTPGHCADVGSTRPTRGKIIGRVSKTYAAGGIHELILFGIGTQGGIQGIVSSATLDFPARGGGLCDDLTMPVPGASIGDPVAKSLPANLSTATRSVFDAWVSATDVVTVRHCSINGTNDPPSATYKVVVHK